MSAHTPGPWSDDASEHDEPFQRIRIRVSYRTICELWQDDAPEPIFNAEQWANARLIGLAPELLSALVALVASAETEPMMQGTHEDAIDDAKAIIARVTTPSTPNGGSND